MIELNMIQLTSTRGAPLWVRADRIESMYGAQQAVIRMQSGEEYLVNESPEEIHNRITHLMQELSARGVFRR